MYNGIHTHLTHHPFEGYYVTFIFFGGLQKIVCSDPEILGNSLVLVIVGGTVWCQNRGKGGEWLEKAEPAVGGKKKCKPWDLGMARAPFFLVWDISKQSINQSVNPSFGGGIRISEAFLRFYEYLRLQEKRLVLFFVDDSQFPWIFQATPGRAFHLTVWGGSVFLDALGPLCPHLLASNGGRAVACTWPQGVKKEMRWQLLNIIWVVPPPRIPVANEGV